MESQTYKNTVKEFQERLDPCPYDPAHQIRPTRFGNHLVNCRKALEKQTDSPYHYKIQDFKICRWNSHHHMHKDELTKHEKECPNSLYALKLMAEPPVKPPVKGAYNPISDINSGVARVMDDDDNWSDDEVAYDPSKKAEAAPMHLPQGLTPAERTNYRIAKRHGEHCDVNQLASSPKRNEEKAKINKKPAAKKQPDNDGWEEVPISKKGIGRGNKKGDQGLANQFGNVTLGVGENKQNGGKGRGRGQQNHF